MKRLFTKLSKYRALILMGAFLFAGIVSGYAEEYKTMIRYDRVWEHISINWDNKAVYYTKFEGPEEINGKTYHRLVTFRKARYDYDVEGKPYLFDEDENYYQHEGYLREEDGKVYTLISDVYYHDDLLYGNLYKPEDNDAYPADLQEKLLYDFSCKEGESYRGLQVGGKFLEEMDYNVKSVEFIEIDGEQCRRLLVSPEAYDYFELPMVEGVGIISEYGCLTKINFLWVPTCPCMDHIFNRVLSTDGRVLFCTEYDATDIPLTGFLGVDNIVDQSKEKSTPIYDMLGRQISNAAPGQLYIQGGKKFIGK